MKHQSQFCSCRSRRFRPIDPGLYFIGLLAIIFLTPRLAAPATLARTLSPAETVAAGAASMPTRTPIPNLVYMQIIAHEDDDILFMNPDIANEIVAGVSTVSVYVTAGQACGVGNCDKETTKPVNGACPSNYKLDANGVCVNPLFDSLFLPLTLTREEFAAAPERDSGGLRENGQCRRRLDPVADKAGRRPHRRTLHPVRQAQYASAVHGIAPMIPTSWPIRTAMFPMIAGSGSATPAAPTGCNAPMTAGSSPRASRIAASTSGMRPCREAPGSAPCRSGPATRSRPASSC